jgi:two-component system sensor histidine kinase KdpD
MERTPDDAAPTLARDLVAGESSLLPDTSSERRRVGAANEPLPASLVDELFSILSHELRAPLTTIKGSSRTLLRHGAALDPAAARQLLQDIDQEADRMHRLVDNLLELARAGVGASALHPEPTALDALIRRVVADATPRAGTRRLRVRVPANLPHPSIDPVRIEQVIRNLVDNAVKFSPPTGLIDVSAALHADGIMVTVKDDGPGVAPEYHERVFERFFRVEPHSRSVAGAGLGLAICKRFVELHGGRIELESRPNQGAAFRFTLPLGDASVQGAAPS